MAELTELVPPLLDELLIVPVPPLPVAAIVPARLPPLADTPTAPAEPPELLDVAVVWAAVVEFPEGLPSTQRPDWQFKSASQVSFL